MSEVVVETRWGKVRGVVAESSASFRGIRYAAPPLGSLRWRPPQPPEWIDGVFEATAFGPIAPQARAGLGVAVPGDHQVQDEDCLFLNVWTPRCDDGGRPVLVFIHGGAFLAGAGSSVLYSGEHLAHLGAVIVTLNYRLGALGFLAYPALADEAGFGNWGLFDQLAALEWVRDNIAGFGGDPRLVTVFGESAGAMSIGDLLGSARARPLFRRAILESGSTAVVFAETAASIATSFAVELGFTEIDRADLERVAVEDLLGAQAAVSQRTDAGVGMPFRPVVDGGLFPEHPAAAIARGDAAGIELIVGTNRDEFKFFSATSSELSGLDEEAVRRIVGRYLHGTSALAAPTPESVVDAYVSARSARGAKCAPRDVLDAFGTDWIFRIPALRMLEAQVATGTRCYSYLFEWNSPFAGGTLGACHGLELPFVFQTFSEPVVALFAGGGEDAAALSEDLGRAWVEFARTGEPSHDLMGEWPQYETKRRETLSLGRARTVVEAPAEEERRFWSSYLGEFGSEGSIELSRAHRYAWLGGEGS